ncbi:hypothetical protein BBF96_15080 [Anoxybacter fermentans]|uniref:GTP cyclohydrolase 1 type 2 homolog n=1 Tax=Anoxybacter fermentans TaxID=1323375 RepID=A0A3Q9HSC0_9FIRM|nr:Nif3-like dinuclear metal center hexameric protein [Anoxybacter fermentans]AZR74579.1 hypothetical protein BBF96_15080 [Anoxybacter fermentans]
MLTTEQIMQVALDMIGIDEIPADSAIYHPGEGIKRVLFGVDMGASEIFLAHQLGYDAVIAHHPTGAVRTFYKIFEEHVRQMVEAGVPEEVARAVIKEMTEVHQLRAQTANADHVPSVARLLNMPYLNIHFPLDQIGRKIMTQVIEEKTTEESTLQDVVDALMTLPEFQKADTEIKILIGDPEAKRGKFVFSHGAGTNGGYGVANAYFEHGIDTVLYIHISHADLKKLRQEAKGNLIVTGHIASDLVGINPFIEKLEEKGLIVDRMSGL